MTILRNEIPRKGTETVTDASITTPPQRLRNEIPRKGTETIQTGAFSVRLFLIEK